MKSKPQIWWIIGTVLFCSAIAFQFYIVLLAWEMHLGLKVLRFFSFFTIVGNTLGALYFTNRLIQRPKGLHRILMANGTTTAITAYLIYISLGYHILLQDVWDPQGLQLVTDKLLHVINPLFFLLYWILVAKKSELRWNRIPRWLILPFAYFAYVLILMGGLGIKHPYPFFDLEQFGYGKVVLIGLAGAVAIALIAAILILGAKLMNQKLPKDTATSK